MKNLLFAILNHRKATEDMAEKAIDGINPYEDDLEPITYSRAYSKNLFDKHINDPEKADIAANSRHINNYISKIGFEAAFNHPSERVQWRAGSHPDIFNHISKIGFDAAFNHPSESCQYAAARHPDVHNHISKIGFDAVFSHPSWALQEAAESHKDLNRWIGGMGFEVATNHPNRHVRRIAKKLYNKN